jgi:hypothetical protein
VDKTQFRIDQLRKDKIIYALESIAFTLIMLFLYIVLNNFFEISIWVAVLLFALPLMYFAYMCFGNTMRFLKILKLEKK